MTGCLSVEVKTCVSQDYNVGQQAGNERHAAMIVYLVC